MDLKELSMPGIYRSIESNITQLKQQISEVQRSSLDGTEVNKICTKVLQPSCEIARMNKVDNLEELKMLIRIFQTCQRPKSPLLFAMEDKTEELKHETKIKPCYLPPVSTAKPIQLPKCRSASSSGVRYPPVPPLNSKITHSPNGKRLNLSSPRSAALQLRSKPDSIETSPDMSMLPDELNSFRDNLETSLCKLQEIFTIFSQRILVPLQTFCKHSKSRTCYSSPIENSAINSESDFVRREPKDLHHCEFIIVQTMNQVKQRLWPPEGGATEQLLSSEASFSDPLQALQSSDIERFSVVTIIPDVIQKFKNVLDCAFLWKKRDEVYVENAKAGLQRATRRYKKTERMWRETKHNQRELTGELNHVYCEIQTNLLRLETLESDVENLKEEMLNCVDEQRTIETRLCDGTDSQSIADNLKMQRKVLKRRNSFLGKKVESKERNYEFMDSRIRSLKADHDAIEEKIRINEEFSESLQNSMVKLLQQKEAWKRRYLEKTDKKLLRKKLEAVGVRIPSPTVREKTFILKTKRENLRDAIEIVSDRLQENKIHWSVLCCHLVWPKQFLITLQSPQNTFSVEEKPMDARFPILSPQKSTEKSRLSNDADADMEKPSFENVIDFVKFRTRDDSEKEQGMFMLKLWLLHSGQQASLDQLVKALRATRLSDTATKLAKLSCR